MKMKDWERPAGGVGRVMDEKSNGRKRSSSGGECGKCCASGVGQVEKLHGAPQLLNRDKALAGNPGRRHGVSNPYPTSPRSPKTVRLGGRTCRSAWFGLSRLGST